MALLSCDRRDDSATDDGPTDDGLTDRQTDDGPASDGAETAWALDPVGCAAQTFDKVYTRSEAEDQ